MEGASVAGGIIDRANAAFDAGCDMVLVCNAPEAALNLLQGLGPVAMNAGRTERLRGRRCADLAGNAAYQTALQRYRQTFDAEGSLIAPEAPPRRTD